VKLHSVRFSFKLLNTFFSKLFTKQLIYVFSTRCDRIAVKLGVGLFQLPYHFNRTGVRVLAMCPGVTDTPLISEAHHRQLLEEWGQECGSELDKLTKQK
jgi:hypothetical protein